MSMLKNSIPAESPDDRAQSSVLIWQGYRKSIIYIILYTKNGRLYIIF